MLIIHIHITKVEHLILWDDSDPSHDLSDYDTKLTATELVLRFPCKTT